MDEKYDYQEDRDLALQIMKIGRICFNSKMIAFVQKQKIDYRQFTRSAGHTKNKVYLFKKFGEKKTASWRIVNPCNLAKILFPPIVFASLFFRRFKRIHRFLSLWLIETMPIERHFKKRAFCLHAF